VDQENFGARADRDAERSSIITKRLKDPE
jgi:hypothetical protein